MKTFAILAAAAAAAATILPVAASAETPVSEAKSVVVPIADLNLGSAAGQQTLKGRIKGAVNQVCGSYPTGLAASRSVAQCRTETMKSAMAQAEAVSPRLRGTVTIVAMR